MQHLMAAFRTPKIRHAQLELLSEEIMAVIVESESGAAPVLRCAYFAYARGHEVGATLTMPAIAARPSCAGSAAIARCMHQVRSLSAGA